MIPALSKIKYDPILLTMALKTFVKSGSVSPSKPNYKAKSLETPKEALAARHRAILDAFAALSDTEKRAFESHLAQSHSQINDPAVRAQIASDRFHKLDRLHGNNDAVNKYTSVAKKSFASKPSISLSIRTVDGLVKRLESAYDNFLKEYGAEHAKPTDDERRKKLESIVSKYKTTWFGLAAMIDNSIPQGQDDVSFAIGHALFEGSIAV